MVDTLVFNYNNTIKDIKINEKLITNNKVSILNLCKLCNFRKEINFDILYDTTILYNKKVYKIQIWGRSQGKINVLNKNDLPTQCNIFGNCIMLCYNNNKLINLTLDFWNTLKSNLESKSNNIKIDTKETQLIDNNNNNNNNEDNCYLDFNDILVKEEYILSDED